jgi:hypothetical protein
MADDFKFSKLNRNSTWKDIFDTIDDNFSKVAEYLATAGNKVRINRFTAKEGQTDFTLTYDYNTAQNSLIVYVNGSRQFLTTGFTETSTNTFKLVTACSAGDQVVAVYNKYYIPNKPELPIATSDQLGGVIPDNDTISVDSSGRIKVNDKFTDQVTENVVTKVSNGEAGLTKDSVGLGNVDNTKDADKPVSTAVQKALDSKANNFVATSSTSGLMSAADKTKLDSIDYRLMIDPNTGCMALAHYTKEA